MTRPAAKRLATRRRPQPPPLTARLAAAAAGHATRLGAWLARLALKGLAALLWPVRFKLILLGAFATGLWRGLRDELRTTRAEWAARDAERRKLATEIKGRTGVVEAESPFPEVVPPLRLIATQPGASQGTGGRNDGTV